MAVILTPSFSFSYHLVAAQTRLSVRTRCQTKVSSHSLQQEDSISPGAIAQHSTQLLRAEKVENIKQRMRMLPAEELEMIDAIQRLAIDYLFYQEISDALHNDNTKFHNQLPTSDHGGQDELHQVALRFRLLRQAGYHVSSDLAFNKFKDKDGKIKPNLNCNAQGLMSLFEASQLGIQEEDLLDEANTYCIQLFNSILGNVEQSPTTRGNLDHARLLRTLKHPHHKSLARFTADDLFCELQNENDWKAGLAELAKLEYGMAQKLYKKEIAHVSQWWETLGLAKELKLTRDQPFKWHMWSLAAMQDPNCSEQRTELTKPISLVYIIDDIFDVHGVPEDLTLFTQAVKSWSFENMDGLPKYMKICLKALFDTTAEISQKICAKYGWNPEESLRKTWADLCDAFLLDSKWSSSGYMPTSEEYLKIGMITSTIPLLSVHLLVILGEYNNDSSSQLVSSESYHKIISSTTIIFRLWNDLGCGKEQEAGKDGSYLVCYMNEHKGISIDDARDHIVNLISEEWKIINKNYLLLPHRQPNSSANIFIKGCLNFARTIPLMYSYDDNNSLPNLQKLIHYLLFKSYV